MRSHSGSVGTRLGRISLSAVLLAVGPGVLCAQAPPDPTITHAGRPVVSAARMAGLCTTMVTPSFPTGVDHSKSTTVVVHALVLHTGTVQPLYAEGGGRAFESAAMSAARLYRYHPYMVDGQPADVSTEIAVTFSPGQPGGLVSHPNR